MQKAIQILLKENILHIRKPKARVLTKRSMSGWQILYLHHMDVSPQLKSSFVFWQVTYKWQKLQYIMINAVPVPDIFEVCKMVTSEGNGIAGHDALFIKCNIH